MALISFLAQDNNFVITDLAGSGIAFFGPGSAGAAVRVSEYQDNSYISDANGTTSPVKIQNVKYVHPNSGELAGSDTRNLLAIPNYLSTLNIRFTHTQQCQTQNAQLRIFDRSNINNPPSGVTCKVAEIIHPWTNATPNGSGSSSWSTLGGSGNTINGVLYDLPLTLANSPGTSGLSPSGSSTLDTQHDWSVAISASPDSNGSKTQFGLFFSVEYL